MGDRGLTRRLGRDLLRQAFYISIAVMVSMFAAGLMVEDVLIEKALEGEADYYWQRVNLRRDDSLPDTKNLTMYRDSFGGVPDRLTKLAPGFHREDQPRKSIIHVTERDGERLYLVFEAEQVDELILLFGIVPLALALIVIYLSTYLAYRVSRRAVSPVVRLAQEVLALDPAAPDPNQLRRDPAFETDDEIQVLASALEDLITRITEFAERERRFTRDASHELRTPLTVIKMAVDQLTRRGGLDDASAKTLERIRNSAEDMERLTTAFLLLARETDQGLARSWVCVNDVVAAEVERARMINPNERTSIHIEAQGRLEVFTPEKIVESVIGNLLRNAILYTDEGEVTVRITEQAVVIDDTGPGMAPDDVEKVFKPYVRQQRQRGGFGVGLTIVKRLTDRFGWPVDIDSEPGRGTRARVTFPDARFEQSA
jgi:signal transduction histidine kinase